ncbi:MAG TPA: hypothetical protein VFC63_10275 [Blastocatellia bacterium]|nr:hypothetical protein [Blastocatellia bacterium]
MSKQYKISLSDGTEYVANDITVVQRLYREGRVTDTLLIQELNTSRWYQLNQLFDVSKWETTSTNGSVAAAAPSPEAAELYGFSSDANRGLEKPSSRGVRMAGFLLLINALLNFATLILIASRGFRIDDAVIPTIVLTIDVVAGIHLLRGEWRTFALVRMGIGAVVVGVLYPLYLNTPLGYVIGFFNLVFPLGFLIMLYHEHISIIRTIVGAGTVTASWLGIIAASVLLVNVPYFKRANDARLLRTMIAPYVLANHHYNDPIVNASANVPNDWLLVKPNNPVVPRPQARMLAIHPESDCYTVLTVEWTSPAANIDTIDDFYGSQQLEFNRVTSGFQELSRDFVHFGNDSAKRMEAKWRRQGVNYHGWFSVCKVGSYYYELSGWCTEGNQDVAKVKFQEIEKLLVIKTSLPNQ